MEETGEHLPFVEGRSVHQGESTTITLQQLWLDGLDVCHCEILEVHFFTALRCTLATSFSDLRHALPPNAPR